MEIFGNGKRAFGNGKRAFGNGKRAFGNIKRTLIFYRKIEKILLIYLNIIF